MVITTPLNDLPSLSKTTAIETALRATVIETLRSSRYALDLGEDAFLAVLSAAEWGESSIDPEQDRILSPYVCAKKRTEFVLGRAAVGYALRELGEYGHVLRGGAGEPIWPEGISGCITHCWPWAAALVVRSRRPVAVGIDLESLEKVARTDISSVICTAEELDWVRQGFSFHERLAMIFSAKEAVYKGIYPFCRQYIDFQDVELSWLPERQSFAVSALGGTNDQFPPLLRCEVHCRCFSGFVFSCMICETTR
jgi:4'-phosphopantetheinyl transferase EntD